MERVCSFCSRVAESIAVKIDQGILEEFFLCKYHIENYSHPIEKNFVETEKQCIGDAPHEYDIDSDLNGLLGGFIDEVEEKSLDIKENITVLEEKMKKHVDAEEFMEAAEIRKQIINIKRKKEVDDNE